jgi:DNA endonuclease
VEPQKKARPVRKGAGTERQGASYSQIAKEVGASQEVVRYWVKGAKPKRVWRYEPDLRPSKDLAYVAGFYLGDGKFAGEEHRVRFELVDGDQLEYVRSLVAKILGRAPKPLGRDGTFYAVDYDSVALSNFLDQDAEKLVQYLEGYIGDFLRGFFDAEGYVSAVLDHKEKTLQTVLVGAANTNTKYLSIIKEALDNLGICSKIRMTNKRGQPMELRGKTWIRKNDAFHCVVLGWDRVKVFAGSVGFENKTKNMKLEDMIRLENKPPADRYAWFNG